MKSILLGLICLGLTNLGFSQTKVNVEQVKLAEVTVTPFNYTYLNHVGNENTPERVKNLQKIVSKFDIKESDVFDAKMDAFEVIFEQSDDKIIATYDNDGNIIKSYERFNNVLLPDPIRKAIYKSYPEWSLHSDSYLVNYFEGKDAKKYYKVQLRKDKKRKSLKIDANGDIK